MPEEIRACQLTETIRDTGLKLRVFSFVVFENRLDFVPKSVHHYGLARAQLRCPPQMLVSEELFYGERARISDEERLVSREVATKTDKPASQCERDVVGLELAFNSQYACVGSRGHRIGTALSRFGRKQHNHICFMDQLGPAGQVDT